MSSCKKDQVKLTSPGEKPDTKMIERVEGKNFTWALIKGGMFFPDMEIHLDAVKQALIIYEIQKDGSLKEYKGEGGTIPITCKNVDKALQKLAVQKVMKTEVKTPDLFAQANDLGDSARKSLGNSKLEQADVTLKVKAAQTISQ